MRWIAVALLGWGLAGAPAVAQAWLSVASADGDIKVEMPVPFDVPDSELEPRGVLRFVCTHETPGLSLRFEVLDSPMAVPGQTSDRILSERIEDGLQIIQTRVYVVGHRTYRLIARSTTEFEGDPMIQRFLTSVRQMP